MMSKPNRQELLRQLQELENGNVEDLVEPDETPAAPDISTPNTNDSITAAKKPRTDKQREAFEKAKAIRDANYAKRKSEAEHKAEQERKILEEKLVKKAIAVKKKQIKQQKILDEIPSDDDAPVQKTKVNPVNPVVSAKPPVKITFF